jgi:Cytochrome c oxidase subunit IV
MLYAAIGVGVSAVIFFTIHSFAKPPPRTMTKEWQEATTEYLRASLHFNLYLPKEFRHELTIPVRKNQSNLRHFKRRIYREGLRSKSNGKIARYQAGTG